MGSSATSVIQLFSALQDVVLYESLGDTNSDSALSDSMDAFEAIDLQCSLILQPSP